MKAFTDLELFYMFCVVNTPKNPNGEEAYNLTLQDMAPTEKASPRAFQQDKQTKAEKIEEYRKKVENGIALFE